MSIARHRIAAGAILLCGCVALVAVGRSVVSDPPEVARLRGQLNGKWVASRIQASSLNSSEGEVAARTTVEFDGRSVKFRNLIEGIDAEGVYVVDLTAEPNRVDFKVDAGWLRGSYSLQGDRLVLCTNALKLTEQLGVPTRGFPDSLRQGPGRYLYEFQRATP